MGFKRFIQELHDLFVPHEKNDYKPHFLRVQSVLYMTAIVAVFGVGAILLQHIIITKTDSLAAIIAAEIVTLTNNDRAQNALGVLTVNPILERAAQMKAEDMAAKSYFAHTSPEGLTPWHWFKQAGYTFVYAGENLAVRFSDSVDVERAWMDSPTHRANLLNTHFTEIGVGIAQGIYEGQPVVFVVQEFGAPAATPVPKVATTPVSQPLAVNETPAPSSPVIVKGAETEMPAEETPAETPVVKENPVVKEEALPQVIQEDPTFIAVKNEAAALAPATVAPSTPLSHTLVQKVVAAPKSAVEAVYLVLASLVWLSLIVMVVVEVKRQYPVNAALAMGLILLMLAFLQAGQLVSGGPVAVL